MSRRRLKFDAPVVDMAALVTPESQIARLKRTFALNLKPPPNITVSEWAERYRKLSSEGSAEPGDWVCWPFQREPMDCMGPTDPCERVVLKCGSQLLKTEAILNFLGYAIHLDPGPALLVEPREEDARTISKDRFDPMVNLCPELKAKINSASGGQTSLTSTILHKTYHGGHVTFVGAISPSGLAMRPIRYLFCDEIDRYPRSAGQEGNPVRLGERRTTNFFNKKIIVASTPTIDGDSPIDDEYAESDQRQFHVGCPFCHQFQPLLFPNVRYGANTPDGSTMYLCAYCGELIEEAHKEAMLSGGHWFKQNPNSKIPGFHLSQLYHPVRTWQSIADEFRQAKGRREDLKVFVNTVLAETFRESGDAPEWEVIKSRAEAYQMPNVPEHALFLTTGVDVQQDRLELYTYGWGRDRQRWLVDFQVYYGSTNDVDDKCWSRLTEYRQQYFTHQSGKSMRITRLAIDASYNPTQVYSWARRQDLDQVMVVRGEDKGVMMVNTPWPAEITAGGKRVKVGVQVWPLNTSQAKFEFYGFLRLPLPEEGAEYPAGWCHFPPMSDEFYQQLVAERYIRSKKHGYYKGIWDKVRDRNEALDCAIYARAAAWTVSERYTDEHWKVLAMQLIPEAQYAKPPEPQPDYMRVATQAESGPGLSIPPVGPVRTAIRPHKAVKGMWRFNGI